MRFELLKNSQKKKNNEFYRKKPLKYNLNIFCTEHVVVLVKSTYLIIYKKKKPNIYYEKDLILLILLDAVTMVLTAIGLR